MVELKGTLGTTGLPEIAQLIGALHLSGNLELRQDDSRLVLGFDTGRLVSAECGQTRGLAALAVYAVELTHANFRFAEGAVQGERSLDLSPSELQRVFIGTGTGEA